MPRTYKRQQNSRCYRPYTQEILDEALLQVAEGHLSIKKAANKYGIPVGTLWNKYHGRHSLSVGRPSALSPSEEKKLAELICVCGDWNSPMSQMDVCMFIKHFMESKGTTDLSLQIGIKFVEA